MASRDKTKDLVEAILGILSDSEREEIEPKTADAPAADKTKALKSKKDHGRFCFVCDKTQKDEILAIARLRGVPVKDPMRRVLDYFLQEYKKQYGEIDTEATRSIDDFFPVSGSMIQ